MSKTKSKKLEKSQKQDIEDYKKLKKMSAEKIRQQEYYQRAKADFREKIQKNDFVGLEGSTGTGKTMLIKDTLGELGKPYIIVPISEVAEDYLLCSTALVEGRTKEEPFYYKVVTKIVDGPLVQAMRKGLVVVLDQANLLSDDNQKMIRKLLEDKQVELPNHEVVLAHPDFKIVAVWDTYMKGEVAPYAVAPTTLPPLWLMQPPAVKVSMGI